VLKTGKTIKDDQILSDKLIAKRRNELFKRIKPSTVQKMILSAKDTGEHLLDAKDNNKENDHSPNKNDHSDTQSLSNYTHITYATDELGLNISSEYIIIDVRALEEFNKFRIADSQHVPVEYVRNDK